MGDTEFAALASINLEINEGEFLVILGPSGSGNSSIVLINLLEYFNFCSLSVDLHAYSKIFCNGTIQSIDKPMKVKP
jgi:ABC-type arginine transport system ATPase subunit